MRIRRVRDTSKITTTRYIVHTYSGSGARHRSVYRLDVRPEHTTGRSKRPSHNNIITTKKKK